jgi:predicted nucleic acid-binding protein
VIVADTNLVAYLVIAGSNTRVAERVFEADADWGAPLLWRSEFRNVLARKVRDADFELPAALETWRLAETLFDEREFQPNGEHVLRLAAASGCTAYDCEFVAVARDLGVPLVTFDREVVRRFPGTAMDAKQFARDFRG